MVQVDYMICFSDSFDFIADLYVHDNDSSMHFPRHCILNLIFKTISSEHEIITNTDLRSWKKYRWNDLYQNDFQQKFTLNFGMFKEQIENAHGNNVLPLLSHFIQDLQNFTDITTSHASVTVLQ